MRHLLLLLLALLLPLPSYGAYNIYLKNGSVIRGVGSYEKKDGEFIINFSSGTVSLRGEDVLNIKETDSQEQDLHFKETNRRNEKAAASQKESPADNSFRANELRAELEKITAEIKAAEAQEADITASIAEKKGTRLRHTRLQLQYIEKEIEPLQQELARIQQRKNSLLQQKNRLEDELRAIE